MLNESTIAELEDTLRRSVLVHKSILGDVAEIGSSVVVEANGGAKLSFIIVGANEAAPLENKISHESPLGRALLGHKKGDTVIAQTPKGPVENKLVDIS